MTKHSWVKHSLGRGNRLLATTIMTAMTWTVVPALAADYHEAPMLDDLVKAGKLPPVAQRLPANPRVETPVEQVGQYGGTWRSGFVGGSDRNWMFRITG
jgi:hypothetical protein